MKDTRNVSASVSKRLACGPRCSPLLPERVHAADSGAQLDTVNVPMSKILPRILIAISLPFSTTRTMRDTKNCLHASLSLSLSRKRSQSSPQRSRRAPSKLHKSVLASPTTQAQNRMELLAKSPTGFMERSISTLLPLSAMRSLARRPTRGFHEIICSLFSFSTSVVVSFAPASLPFGSLDTFT